MEECESNPGSVKTMEVSSTKASASRSCSCCWSGDLKVIRSLMSLSSVLSRITTSVSQTAGDAPLP
jgi:hypothetical protein